MPYSIHILTLFPDFFASPLTTSLTGKAIERGFFDVNLVDIRDFAADKHKSADDVP
ncbi:MAG: tRNA (guanosine(37)-N1)-methyltransferase TrmD, partial [Bradymonadaceae bacterium]